jgi:hypothetical protein
MRHVLVLGLLIFLQTAPPTPRQAIEKGTQNSDAKHGKTTDNETPTNKAQTIPNVAQPKISQPNDEDHTSQKEKEPVAVKVPPVNVRKDGFDYTYIIASVLIAIATLVLALYAVRQANAAKKSADTYEQTVRLTERADVLLEAAGFEPPDITKLGPVVLVFKNFGRTTANRVLFEMIVTVPELGNYKALPLPYLPIGSGDNQRVVFSKMKEWLSRETFLQVLDGRTTLRFSGKVTYTDVFGIGHTTKCSGIYVHRTGTFHIEENEAD